MDILLLIDQFQESSENFPEYAWDFMHTRDDLSLGFNRFSDSSNKYKYNFKSQLFGFTLTV